MAVRRTKRKSEVANGQKSTGPRLSRTLIRERQDSVPEIHYASDLPIAAHIERIQELLRTHQVVIVAGETGSGKTTQLPLACLEAGFGVNATIAHTQPRRLAARAVAGRIAEQLKVNLGEQIGYAVRFDESWSRRSLVKVMTDGMLLAEINRDRELRRYEVVIVDEAHERTLNVDFLLGFLRRLIDKRPELKVIITSATIDVESFSRHFDNAPVVEVEGRSYPVTVEYRPPDDDLEGTVFGCLDEILESGIRGAKDILMFLPTEQEILEWSNRIRRRFPKQLEVLPLYARLPPRDQQRIFQPSGRQRILLSTNVAETSLTVPNIRFVIDLGKARISRYSARSRVQRLPIEQVSQASADQRMGRCGRVAPGICYRVYSEAVYERVPRYTDPELKRTNLASVLLQTKHFRLGDIRKFPFLEPPDERSIGQAERLLHELGALDDGQLTGLGRQMARMPIDPRYARVLIEAAHRNALKEALIVVSALTAQDPRLRPHNQREAADSAQERFSDEKSDFLTLVNLWFWAERERQTNSSSGFRRLLERHFISPNRYFEWRSLHRQLTGYCQRLGLRLNSKQASYKNLHTAILTGSLGLIGTKEEKQKYAGVHDLRFQLLPGTRIGKASPKWVVAAEIVETGRVYARTVASIERKWIEDVASRLLKLRYFDEYWDDRRGEAMILSRATLYGLPVYERRPLRLAPRDAELARELFVRHALVEPKQLRPWPFLKHNRQLLSKLLKIQARERRTDVVVAPRVQASFYLERIPDDVLNVRTFEMWFNDASAAELDRLRMTDSNLLRRPDEDLTNAAFPGELVIDDYRWPLRYRFAPGDVADGVSVQVKAENISSLSLDAVQWLVPGRLAEKLTELLKSLPKQYRRHLVPIPDRVEQLCDYLLRPSRYRIGNFYDVLSRTLADFYHVQVPPDVWDEAKLSPFLRMNVQWTNRRGGVLDQDRDLVALKRRHEATLADALVDEATTISASTERHVKFPEQGIETKRRLRQGHTDFTVFPALVDKGDYVEIEIAVNEAQQRVWHEKGLCRLFVLSESQSVRYLKKEYQKETNMHMQLAKLADPNAILDSLLMSVARYVYLNGDERIETRSQFDRLLTAHRGEFVSNGLDLIATCSDIAEKRFDVSLAVENISSAVLTSAKTDLEKQLSSIVPADFMWQTPYERLADLPRYLEAMLYRINHFQGRVSKDEELMTNAREWENRLEALVARAGYMPDLVDAKFLLAELRVALFHQKLGTKEKTSRKRLTQTFEQLERTYIND